LQVETIGDAYCVAGGLHKQSRFHAQQIAFMSLRMMATAKTEKSKDGNVLRVSNIYQNSHMSIRVPDFKNTMKEKMKRLYANNYDIYPGNAS